MCIFFSCGYRSHFGFKVKLGEQKFRSQARGLQPHGLTLSFASCWIWRVVEVARKGKAKSSCSSSARVATTTHT